MLRNFFTPVDYLVVGHLTVDLTPNGPQMGGTAAFAALTARALGMRAGIVTSFASDHLLSPLAGIQIANYADEKSTTFENIYTSKGRLQTLHHLAPALDLYHIPEAWRSPSILHLAPVAQEVEPGLARSFSSAMIGITPQGWLRSWNKDGHVSPTEWPEASFVLSKAGATVISYEDVGEDEARIEEFASYSPVLAVTEGANGARVYWNGDVRRFRAPQVDSVDTTGAGDIFAAAFFYRLFTTRDPWEATRFAVRLASLSVTRHGLEGIPTAEEVMETMMEVF